MSAAAPEQDSRLVAEAITRAGVHAGVPQLVVPHMVDQPYWGRRVPELGVGPRPVPRRALTAERMARGLLAARSPHHRRAAAALAEALRLEDGVTTAVRHLETGLGRGTRLRPDGGNPPTSGHRQVCSASNSASATVSSSASRRMCARIDCSTRSAAAARSPQDER